METARGMQDAPPRMEEKPEWWASPAVIGLMGFGLTTIIAGLSDLPQPYGTGFGAVGGGLGTNWVTFGMAIAFGGLAQFVAGFIALRKGNMFAGSAFVGYGAFWIAFTLMLASFAGLAGPGFPVAAFGVAGFAFVWMMFTLTFLINSMKHGWGIFFVFLFLFVAFILLVVQFWQVGGGHSVSKGQLWATGGEIILTGATAWYVATADLTNWNYGRKVLPV
ncbi:MAG TPA: acetate uptake transporter [Thermoplasmata archaeon]|nr:acetate uptake transporter [Thermoplasmata archaeon]